MSELQKTSYWSRWPISWPASHGQFSPAEKTTGQTAPCSQHREIARKRRLRLGTLARSHFTALRRRLEVYPPRTAQKQHGRKNRHNGLPENLLGVLFNNNRPTNEDRYARNSSRPGALCYTEDRIHLRRLVFPPLAFSLQSDSGPYVDVQVAANGR